MISIAVDSHIQACIHSCWQYTVGECLKRSMHLFTLKSRLLVAECQRTLFVKIMDRVTEFYSLGHPLVSENYCFKGHDLKSLSVQRLFNRFAKNAVEKFTSEDNQSNQQPAKRRKIATFLVLHISELRQSSLANFCRDT